MMCATVALTITAMYPSQLTLKSMWVKGDFSTLGTWSNSVQMSNSADDTWRLTLDIDSTHFDDLYSFKVLANGDVWQVGANEMVKLSSSNPSSCDIGVEIFPWFGTQQGTYQYINRVFSPQLNNVRNLVVYTPPSYTENPYKKFSSQSVLLAHDGQNLFNPATAAFGCWNCQDTLNAMIIGGEMREIIMVGIDNTDGRIYEYTYSNDPTVSECRTGGCGGADLYLDFVEETVIPLIQSSFRVDSDNSTRWAMLGSSLGGLVTCYAGWTRPEVYDRMGCMSTSFWWNYEDFNTTIIPSVPQPPLVAAYLDSGDSGQDDDDVVQTTTVTDHLLAVGFRAETSASPSNRSLEHYIQAGGEHSEYYWGSRFNVPMAYLYPPSVTEAS